MNNFPYLYGTGKMLVRAGYTTMLGEEIAPRYESVLFRKLKGVVEVRVTRTAETPEWAMRPHPTTKAYDSYYSMKSYLKKLKKLSRNLTEVSVGNYTMVDSSGYDTETALIVTGWSKKLSDKHRVALAGVVFS